MNKKKINFFFKFAEEKLFPINRSITGKGILKTLNLIKNIYSDLKINKIKSGTKVFDWSVPPEWNISDAYILDGTGNKIVDFKKNNLHIVGYSTPVEKKISKSHLLKRLHSIPSIPNAIPYVTSYYKKYWGFCVTHSLKKKLIKDYGKKDRFLVKINSQFNLSGNLKYGELLIKGKSKKEILISTYICHPSMANNELSGPILSMCLIDYFKKTKQKRSLRFLFIPETIGSISYINKNIRKLKKNVIGGYNLSCVGDENNHSCMLSKLETSPSDFSLLNAYKKLKINFKIYPFLQRGSDERQYNSPGIDLPIASIFRSKYGNYKEYHTSLDNFDFITSRGIEGAFKVAKEAIINLSNSIIPKYKNYCEPFLSKKNLYPTISTKGGKIKNKSFLDFLQYADGKHDLSYISKKIQLSLTDTKKIYNKLMFYKLITNV